MTDKGFPLAARYGVREQVTANTELDHSLESLRLLGYAVIEGGYKSEWLSALSEGFERAYSKSAIEHGGHEALRLIDEHYSIRAPLAYEDVFLELAANEIVLEICRRSIGEYIILNQQNGIINPPHGARYNQSAWHRDLPYQHFVSSRPLAINALFCLDAFTDENGATLVVPMSHRQEEFPSERFLSENSVAIKAPKGSFIILDAMVFHCGGVNHTAVPRRAISHLYSIPLLRQQIDLPRFLGDDFSKDALLRRLLGYEIGTPLTITEFFATRRHKVRV